MNDGVSAPSLAEALRRRIPHCDIHEGVPGAVLDTWNFVGGQHPLARIECRDAASVAATVEIAAEMDVPMTIAGGRLDAFGRNNRSGHLVVDLRRMAEVSYDVAAGVVTSGGGATVQTLLDALPQDIVAAAAVNGEVGVIGTATGGGYGLLSGRLGLMCDGLVSADVVLADGSRVVASEKENADLLWGLRGGGSGFGVVTSASFSTLRLPRILAATIRVPPASLALLLKTAQATLDEHPDELGLVPLSLRPSEARPDVLLVFGWHGREDASQAVLGRFESLPGAEVLTRGSIPYRATLNGSEGWPWGRCWDGDTRVVSRIDGTIADLLAEMVDDMPSGSSLFAQDFHGAGTRVAPDATAFWRREEHFVIATTAQWAPGDEATAARQRAWVDRISLRLAPHSLPGGSVSLLRPDQGDRVRQSYGANADRLVALKRKVDPSDRFRCAAGRFDP